MYWKNFSCELLKTQLKSLKSGCFSLLRSFLDGVLNRVFNSLWKTFHSTPCKLLCVKMEYRRVFSRGSAFFLSFAERIVGARLVFGSGKWCFIQGKVFHSFSQKHFHRFSQCAKALLLGYRPAGRRARPGLFTAHASAALGLRRIYFTKSAWETAAAIDFAAAMRYTI